MSLIDSSYFKGPLTIPQLGQPAVVDSLNDFIQQQEPLFLQAALGYELWEDFVAGLNAPVIEQKWLDLRDGVTFQANGLWPPFQWRNGQMTYNRDWGIPMTPTRRMRWVGFCGGTPQPGSNNSQGSIKTLVTGRSADDPVPLQNSFTSAALAGTQYTIERRNFGTMIPGDNISGVITPANADVNISNNGQTITLLKPGDVFGNGEVFVLHFVSIAPAGSPSIVYLSPVAAYVYYEWLLDQAGNMSAFGVVKGEAENAQATSGMLKMYSAFYNMTQDILKLWQFLDIQGTAVYASYDRLKIDYNYFKPINAYGI